MLVTALISLAVSSASAAVDPQQLYAPPVVRPYEPPSNFGRIEAEGDGGGDPTRRPIVRPVAVEAYRGTYEYAPTTADETYNRGVAEAEARMDARMGPLDGAWLVKDAAGVVRLSLALMDPGGREKVEGAWRKVDGAAGPSVIDSIERSAGGVVLTWSQVRLDLHPGEGGWTGELTLDGRSQPVTLSR